MAEFLNQERPKKFAGSGFDAMGKPVPVYRKTAALEHCRDMGLTDTEQAMACIDATAAQLERDEPYEAMRQAMKWLDLTGTYRLFAVLLTAEPVKES